MAGNFSIVLLACLSLLAAAKAQGPKCGFAELKKCCPSLPVLLNEESVRSCMPPRPEGTGGDKNEGSGGRRPPPGGRGKAGGKDDHGSGPKHGGHHGNKSCFMECAFEKDGFITVGADGKKTVNLDAVNKKLTEIGTGAWETITKDAITNCTSVAPEVKKNNGTCTSGAGKVARCLMRALVSKCPDAVDTPECKERMENMVRTGDMNEMKGKMGDKKQMSSMKEKKEMKGKSGRK